MCVYSCLIPVQFSKSCISCSFPFGSVLINSTTALFQSQQVFSNFFSSSSRMKYWFDLSCYCVDPSISGSLILPQIHIHATTFYINFKVFLCNRFLFVFPVSAAFYVPVSILYNRKLSFYRIIPMCLYIETDESHMHTFLTSNHSQQSKKRNIKMNILLLHACMFCYAGNAESLYFIMFL